MDDKIYTTKQPNCSRQVKHSERTIFNYFCKRGIVINITAAADLSFQVVMFCNVTCQLELEVKLIYFINYREEEGKEENEAESCE